MTQPPTNERRTQLPAFHTAHRTATWWLAAIVGSVALLLATPAMSHAAETAPVESVESNPNDYSCHGHISAGTAEVGSEEEQVKYVFACNGPITGYQLQAQIPLTGVESPPLVTTFVGKPATDTFSCSLGEVPGFAANCVGGTKLPFEAISGQFAIGTKLCAEPRVDPLLSVTYAYLEKNVVTQAISGPFDLGRPLGCKADALSGGTRLDPKPPVVKHHKKGKKGKKKASTQKK
jgi:hypothetical protein